MYAGCHASDTGYLHHTRNLHSPIGRVPHNWAVQRA